MLALSVLDSTCLAIVQEIKTGSLHPALCELSQDLSGVLPEPNIAALLGIILLSPASFQISGRKFPSILGCWIIYLQGNRIPGGPEVTHSKKVWFEREGVCLHRTDPCRSKQC